MGDNKIVFTRKISHSGKNIVKIISIPKSLHPLVEYGKTYKITLELLPPSDSKEEEEKCYVCEDMGSEQCDYHNTKRPGKLVSEEK